MSEMECDTCGQVPFTESSVHCDAVLKCSCDRKPVNIVFDEEPERFRDPPPDYWGETRDVGAFKCYQCGSSPELRTSVLGGMPPQIRYYIGCECGISVGFEFRNVFPDGWKDDMDETKWELSRDDIADLVYERREPITREDVVEEFGVSETCSKSLLIRAVQNSQLHSKRVDGEHYYFNGVVSLRFEKDDSSSLSDLMKKVFSSD